MTKSKSLKKERPSPSKSATLFKIGTKKKGNDGNTWVIKETKNKTKRWGLAISSKSKANKSKKSKKRRLTRMDWMSKYKSNTKSLGSMKKTNTFVTNLKKAEYLIHDNGGRPFKVVVNSEGLFCYTYDDKNEEEKDKKYDILKYKVTKFDGYWTGFDSSPYKLHGNSILVKLSDNKYVYIGSIAYQFETEDKILDYVSPVGNSNVPYPIAYGEDNLYYMLDKQYIKREDIDIEINIANSDNPDQNLYRYFYNANKKIIHTMKRSADLIKRKW
jgi:hypothetical protein